MISVGLLLHWRSRVLLLYHHLHYIEVVFGLPNTLLRMHLGSVALVFVMVAPFAATVVARLVKPTVF